MKKVQIFLREKNLNNLCSYAPFQEVEYNPPLCPSPNTHTHTHTLGVLAGISDSLPKNKV